MSLTDAADVALAEPPDQRPLRESLLQHLHFTLAKDRYSATPHDFYVALAYAIRDRLIARWLQTQQRYYREDRKRVYYLSMEYLTGRSLANALLNLGTWEQAQAELATLDLELDQLIELEWEAGLGNGGLGRLAACLLDSLATLEMPAYGYGIRYEYGIFRQKIQQGAQVESPDNWLQFGNPWEIGRPEDLYPVRFGGSVREYCDRAGRHQFEWVGGEDVMAMAYDMPIPGYGNDTVNTLRLWSAKSSHEFNLEYFNRGDYVVAVEDKSRSESISRVLYPNDNFFVGKELRLKQEYFFVSASLQDILRRYKKVRSTFEAFADKVAIQLNDTHPALAIPELMRIFVDCEQLGWETAWELVVATFGYTNHTLLPEALEQWPVSLIERTLPRHLQIIYEINHRFLRGVRRQYPGDMNRVRRMSLIDESGERRVRMAHLAVVGSHRVNGVSKLHSSLLRSELFRDFDEYFPWRFCSATNGVTPRRWLRAANPPLASLITDAIGPDWTRDLAQLERLTDFQHDSGFLQAWAAVKRDNKRRLAEHLHMQQRATVHLDALFDCQVKRIHEYKRQLLNIFHVIALYNRIRTGATAGLVPRTVLIGGKAAPGYVVARRIIELISAVGEVINNDPQTGDWLRVVFLENYNVSLAELVFPATELSEQISTAGTEASGTGNMKAMLNGALTIGTLDGANLEIHEAVGDDAIFIFGRSAMEAKSLAAGAYDPHDAVRAQPQLGHVIEMIRDGFFSDGDERKFQPLLDSIFHSNDRYLVLAEFADYLACQQRVAAAYHDPVAWAQKSIVNVAQAGRFSSDRTALVYAREIWGL